MRSLTVLVGSIKIYNCFFFVGQADRGFTTSQRSFQADAVASLAPPPRPCSAMPAVAGGPSSSDSQWNAPVADSVVDDDRWGGRGTRHHSSSCPHPSRTPPGVVVLGRLMRDDRDWSCRRDRRSPRPAAAGRGGRADSVLHVVVVVPLRGRRVHHNGIGARSRGDPPLRCTAPFDVDINVDNVRRRPNVVIVVHRQRHAIPLPRHVPAEPRVPVERARRAVPGRGPRQRLQDRAPRARTIRQF
jgi:hypothetical protein